MQSSQFFSVLIILFAVVFSCSSSARYNRPCKESRCEGHCHDCVYGSVWSPMCGYQVCAKGPGDKCGEYQDICGAGLICQCSVCHGCSTTKIGEKCADAPPCLPNDIFVYPNWAANRGFNQLE